MGMMRQPGSSIKSSERAIQVRGCPRVILGGCMSVASRAKRVTTNTLQEMKVNGEKIAMLTAYDFSLARLVDASGIDVKLVGDSASNVMAGHETTVPITLDQMIYHAQSVVRAVQRALVVVDMPFGTYQSDSNNALKSAIRIMKETGGHAVKLEGGTEVLSSVRKIIDAGIPVMGHIGLLPQRFHQLGAYRTFGRSETEKKTLLEDALAFEAAGCFAILCEMTDSMFCGTLSSELKVPLVGIGSGPHCDGQILVSNDLLGLGSGHVPGFVKQYASLGQQIESAFSVYAEDVRNRRFPS